VGNIRCVTLFFELLRNLYLTGNVVKINKIFSIITRKSVLTNIDRPMNRLADKLHMCSVSSSYGAKSIKCKESHLWNNLPFTLTAIG